MNSELSIEIQEFIEKPSTQNLLIAAQDFIDLLETKNIDKEEFYKNVHLALIDLYVAGHKLEQIDLKYYSDTNDKFDRNELFENKNIGQILELGDVAFYWEVFDPTYEKNCEPVQGWLVDDFLDIYRDLKIELAKINNIRTNEAIESGLWGLKWSFVHHWGDHCINAMRYLHYLYYDGKQSI